MGCAGKKVDADDLHVFERILPGESIETKRLAVRLGCLVQSRPDDFCIRRLERMLRIKPPIGDLLAIKDGDLPNLIVRIMDDIVGDVGPCLFDPRRVEACTLQKMDAAELLIHFDSFYFFREWEGQLVFCRAQLNDSPNIEGDASELLQTCG